MIRGWMNYEKIEILISTYNRPQILQQWFNYGLKYIDDLGMAVAVYDSSTDNKTEMLVEQINSSIDSKIRYVHVDSKIRLDDKIMMSILDSKCEYVWPMGDSRILDPDDIKGKVLPSIDRGMDFCCMFCSSEASDGEVFHDPDSFFRKCFWHATLLGGIIFKKAIFAPLLVPDCLAAFNNKYNRNDGFSYLGVFYDLIADQKIKAVFAKVRIIDVGFNKTPGWIHRYLDVWCGNLVYLIDNINGVYNESKDYALRYTWKVLELDGEEWLYQSRIACGLTPEKYDYYDQNGYLDRVSTHKDRIREFAYGDINRLKRVYYLCVFKRKVVSRVRRVQNMINKI